MIFDICIDTPIREDLSSEDLWHKEDKGIIKAWELGREWSVLYPHMRTAAKEGVLLELKRQDGETKDGKPNYIRMFKGGFDAVQKETFRYGSLHYYAMWLGLRGNDLSIDLENEYPFVCTKTKMGVVYTIKSNKYLSTKISSSELHQYGSEFISMVSG